MIYFYVNSENLVEVFRIVEGMVSKVDVILVEDS